MANNLLLDEEPLLVLKTLACKVGLPESIVLQQIHYWNRYNEKHNNNLRDGYNWTFNSYEQWQEQFPFWSIKTIQRIINNLENMNLVISSTYNKLKIDKTKWYRINYPQLETLANSHEVKKTSRKVQSDLSKKSKRLIEEVKVTKAIPKTNSKINPKTKTERLHQLSEIDDPLIFSYLELMRRFGLKHKYVSEANLYYIENAVTTLESYGVALEIWEDTVYEHFDNLPSTNDGDIMAFLKTSKRNFEIDLERELA